MYLHRSAGMRELQKCGKCIAHTGDGQANGTLGNYLGVHKYQVRILLKELILFELTFVSVNDRKGRAWCVRGCNGWHDNDRKIFCSGHGFCGIKDFTATDTDYHFGATGIKHLHKAVNLSL